MKMYLISDNIDTQTGMRLAGWTVWWCTREKNCAPLWKRLWPIKKSGFLLLTESSAENSLEIVDEVKLHHKVPLIVEIPDRHGTGPETGFYHLLCQRSHWTKTVTINKEG